MREVIILAGGQGTRLRPTISNVPKCMAPIGNKPFLEIILEMLNKNKVERVVLALGYMAEQVIDYFGERYRGLELDYSVELSPLGTGGAIKMALNKCVNNHVCIMNGDSFINLDYEGLENQWLSNKNPIIVGVEVSDASRFGGLLVDKNRVIKFCEKTKNGHGLINAGVYLLARDCLSNFPKETPFSIEKDYFEIELQNRTIEFFYSQSMFIDIGVPEDYSLAQKLF